MIYEEDTTPTTVKVPPPPHRSDCPACGGLSTLVLRPVEGGRLSGTCGRCGAEWVLVTRKAVRA